MMMNLLNRLPSAICLTTWSSRAGVKTRTYCGVTAASSMTTPAVLALALGAAVSTSSTTASKPNEIWTSSNGGITLVGDAVLTTVPLGTGRRCHSRTAPAARR